MGGAQPLAVTMNGAAVLAVEVDPARIAKRIETRYCDRRTASLDEALAGAKTRRRGAPACRSALDGQRRRRLAGAGGARRRARRASPIRPRRTIRWYGYVPAGMSLADAAALRAADPDEYIERATRVDGGARAGHAGLAGARVQSRSTTATTCASARSMRAWTTRSAYPGFVPAYIRPLFCEGKGPFRWVALSGDPDDIHRTDELCSSCSRTTSSCAAGSAGAGARRVPGTAGAHLLAGLRRARAGLGCALNELVASGEVSAPIVIGRDHLDTGIGRLAVSAKPRR